MAKIIFSSDELIKTLKSNDLLPKNIVRVKAKGDSIHFCIKTQSFILPFIPVSLKLLSFSGNNVTFELTVVSSQVSKTLGRFDQLLDFKMPEYMKLEYPNIVIDIDKLLHEKNIRGLRLRSVVFENDKYIVETDSV
jgi:hypothetical protein